MNTVEATPAAQAVSSELTPSAQEQSVRVLLIEDSEDEMLLVKYALQECGGGRYTLEWEDTLSRGKEHLREGGIGIILLDLGLPGYSGAASYAALRQAAPDLPIVVLTSDDREQTELVVMTYGAEDYLVKEEISASHLLHSLRGALYRHRHRPPVQDTEESGGRGFSVGFIGAKGGVGTTTTVLNPAAALEPDRTACVIETAVQRSGFAHQLRTEKSAAAEAPQATPERQSFLDLLTPTCLKASVMFEPLRHSIGIESSITQARDMIRLAARQADLVLVDAGSQWDALTQAVLRECQHIVLVVDRESSSFAAVRDWARRVMEAPISSRRLSVLVVDRSGLVTGSFLEKMQASFGFSVLGTVPHAGEQLGWALERRRPLAYMDRCDPYSVAVSELIEPLVETTANAMAG